MNHLFIIFPYSECSGKQGNIRAMPLMRLCKRTVQPEYDTVKRFSDNRCRCS